jgi:hypothetical protein
MLENVDKAEMEMKGDTFAGRDLALSLLIFMGLALPFLPIPGDRTARMNVRYHAPGMSEPRAFSTDTLHSLCAVLGATLAYEEPDKGNFTRITCDD